MSSLHIIIIIVVVVIIVIVVIIIITIIIMVAGSYTWNSLPATIRETKTLPV